MDLNDGWFRGRLVDLAREECLELLATKRVGRVAFDDGKGPVVLPVNYVVRDGAVVFRTSPYTALAAHVRSGVACFEVDEVDDFTESGWSVVVRGPAAFVEVEDQPADAGDRPSPWPEGVRSLHVQVPAQSVTGRRLLPG